MSEKRILSADVVVIGSGICGALVARRLGQQGASVLILEAGPRIRRDDVFKAFIDSPRKRDFQAPYPFSPWAPHPDFQLQTLYGAGVDWPIDYRTLDPFYQEAEVIMGVAGDAREHPESRRFFGDFPLPPVVEPFAMRRLRERLAQVASDLAEVGNTQARNNCQPLCPIDAQYHGGKAADAAEKAGALLTPNAVVYKLEHAGSRIMAAHYFDPQGNSFRVTGNTFILAANGIESPKLLLLSSSPIYPNGLANSSGMVGRNLMDHPSTSLDFSADEDVWLGRGPQSTNSIQTFRDGGRTPDPMRKVRAAYRLDFTNISRVLGTTQTPIAEGVYGVEFDRRLRFTAARQMSVKNVLEILPTPANRVALSSKKDAQGIPKPEMHFEFDNYTIAGARDSHTHFRRIPKIMSDPRSNAEIDALLESQVGVQPGKRAFSNNQHICGTVSIGHNPARSVVDPFGRSNDHENLFMVGTGVLPTSATCNSTPTAVAVALRTAPHIRPR